MEKAIVNFLMDLQNLRMKVHTWSLTLNKEKRDEEDVCDFDSFNSVSWVFCV